MLYSESVIKQLDKTIIIIEDKLVRNQLLRHNEYGPK